MSFILDALKKSESDRQRQSGPALFEVRVAPPRTRLPLWAIAIALLLVLNLGVVLWMLLRHQGHAAAPPAASASGSAAGVSGPAAVAPAGAAGAAGSSASMGAAVPSTVPAAAAPAPASGPAAVPVAAANAVAAASPPPPVTGVTSGPSGPPAAAAAASGGESPRAEDYAPAEEPAASGFGGHVRTATASGVPLYQDLSSTPGTQLPQLRLDLHVFAARPEERFVMVNMHKLREGDTLPEGVRVDSITPEGAVMSYNGTRFLLPRD